MYDVSAGRVDERSYAGYVKLCGTGDLQPGTDYDCQGEYSSIA